MSLEPFIKCSDIQVSLEFYTKVLDFDVVQAPDPEPESFMSMYAFLKRGDSYLHLSQHAGDGVFGNVVFVRIKSLDELYSQFLGNGLKVQERSGISMEPVEQTWGVKEFSVRDPDGNRFTFGQQMS